MRGGRLQKGKELKFGTESCKLPNGNAETNGNHTTQRTGRRRPATNGPDHSTVEEILATTPFIDIHTHLFPPGFGGLGLWGIDELLTYHYLEAELFRSSSIAPEQYWEFSKRQQADEIWRALFVENSPVSEATRGVIAVLNAFDLPTDSSDLEDARSSAPKGSNRMSSTCFGWRA